MRQKLARNHLRRKSGKSGNSSGWPKRFPAAPTKPLRFILPPNERPSNHQSPCLCPARRTSPAPRRPESPCGEPPARPAVDCLERWQGVRKARLNLNHLAGCPSDGARLCALAPAARRDQARCRRRLPTLGASGARRSRRFSVQGKGGLAYTGTLLPRTLKRAEARAPYEPANAISSWEWY